MARRRKPEPWPFDGLFPGMYRTIYADPPWRFAAGGTRNPSTHYPTMTLAEIKALPVKDLAHPEGCRLLMWITMPLADRIPEVLKAWGFRYSTARVWAKLWPREDEMFIYPDSLSKGTGYEVRNSVELLVIGKRGKPARPSGPLPASLVFARRREHSRKPDMFRDEAARVYPGPHAELFARTSAPGWAAWGNEVGKFR